MSPERFMVALVLAALAGTGLLAIALWHAMRLLRHAEGFASNLERAQALGVDQARRVAALESLQETQRAAEQVLDTGTSIVREVHKGIANIPFNILEAIPGAREPAKLVRGLHDSISDGVYGALSGLNKAVGRELRKGMKAQQPATPIAQAEISTPNPPGLAPPATGDQDSQDTPAKH